MANMASEFTKTYTSFSGCDIVASFGGTVIGELQAITYSISREKAPLYTMGSAEPRSFSRGKRGIAGTLVFTVFDQDSLVSAVVANSENSITKIGSGIVGSSAITIDDWDTKMTGSITGKSTANEITNSVSATANPHYADEVPPFDITISFSNEYGQKSVLVIYGCEILNEGSGFSIDNVTSERACTFVARRIDPMRKVAAAS